jgi:hypothetical protein
MFCKIRILLMLTTAAVLSGCSSVSVHSDFNSSADFSEYRTFSYISSKPLLVADVAAVSPLLEGRLMKITRAELAAKGYRYTDDRDAADFVISFTLGARDKIRINSYPSTYRGAYYGGWAAPYHSEVDVRNYTEGTLALDLFDVKSKSPVWHGWAVNSITAQERANPEPLLKEIVGSILEQFPPDA